MCNMNDNEKINFWKMFFWVFIGLGLIALGLFAETEPTKSQIESTIQ